MDPEILKNDEFFMKQALTLAARGRGSVEPNPMVGCVLASPEGRILGQGWHQKFGRNHAEVNALEDAAQHEISVKGATAYVTLEPCCHYGKTPPCALALKKAGIARVVAAMRDPFPKVAGGGFQILQEAGISVSVGVCEAEARALNAPYLKLVMAGRPWVIGKWAMTLDGKIATRTHSSRWVSSALSREKAHETRARVDGILVGVGTVLADDPMLTARPQSAPVLRKALRIVADSRLETPLTSRLVQTAHEIPVLLAVGEEVSEERILPYQKAGCEIFRFSASVRTGQMAELLDELGRRRLTNLLAEGGSAVLGTLLDLQEINEINVFVAPKLCGGKDAVPAIGGYGLASMEDAFRIQDLQTQALDGDLFLSGRVQRQSAEKRYGNLELNLRET